MQQSNINEANLTPIWYFAFGQQAKSSLLNEYSREHNVKYLQKVPSAELQKYVNNECIIESDVQTLLEWEPKKKNISVVFIGKEFTEEELKIRQDYEQIARCKYHGQFDNYEAFRKTMYPNLIFFYGPNKESRQGAAATIGFQNLYKYVDKFPPNANQIISTFNRWENYTFSWLFSDPKQIQILLSRFNLKIVIFKYNRSDFPNEQKYFDTEYSIINYMQGKPYFLSIDAHALPEVMMDQIGEFLCPKLIFINSNNEIEKNYARSYARDRNTQLFSIFEIQGINKRKNISLALTVQDKVRRVNSIIYNNFTAKEVILVDFPWHTNEVRVFENINRKFSRFVDLDPEREYMYSSIYSSNIYFLQTQRRIHPNLDFPLINQIEENRRYWIVVGPQAAGKTTVAKYLENQYQMINIEFEPYIAGLKEKLLTPEDGEELPVRKVIAHFKDLFSKNQEKEFLIDGFSYTNNDFKDWIHELGAPTFINLRVDENQLIKRQRKKAEADLAAQVTEEQTNRVKQATEKQNQWIEKVNELSPDTLIYGVDFNQTMILAQKLLQSIFEPRVFLIQSNPTLLYQNIAIRYNCCIINLAIYSLQKAKKIAKSCGKRDVIIANYRQTEDKLVSQDLYWIEKNIGKIRYLAIWMGEEKTYLEEQIPLERPVEVKKVKQPVEGEQGQQQPPQEEETVEQDGEPKKKKLDIFAYEWTKPICHKNLSQWYFKLKKNIEEFTTEPREAYKAFRQKLQKINSNPNVNIYEVLKPVTK